MFRWLIETPVTLTRRQAIVRLLGIAASAVVITDVLARLVFRFISSDHENVIYGLCAYGVTVLVTAGIGFSWAKLFLLPTVWRYAAAAAVPAAVFIGVFGAWISGENFTETSPMIYVLRVLLAYVVMGAGTIVGALMAVALGCDVTGRAWSAHAEKLRNLRGPVKPRA
ncbi:MAG TPA: hypothetical protein VHU91_05270 [Mycobacteriales bacterium]|nr:hypothetical protein [Mycobacteriales bacterium]